MLNITRTSQESGRPSLLYSGISPTSSRNYLLMSFSSLLEVVLSSPCGGVSHVVAGAVLSSKVAAGMVSPSRVFCGVACSSRVVAGMVSYAPCGRVVLGVVSPAEVVAGWIFPSKVVVGVVSAAEVVAGAIFPSMVVSAAEVAAGVVHSSMVVAGVVAEKVHSSMVADGMVAPTQLIAGMASAAEVTGGLIFQESRVVAGVILPSDVAVSSSMVVDGLLRVVAGMVRGPSRVVAGMQLSAPLRVLAQPS